MSSSSSNQVSSSGILRAEFVYKGDAVTHVLTRDLVKAKVALGTPTAMAVDFVVGLAAKVAESVIDAAAARMQAEATTLDTTIPLDGFYAADGSMEVDAGYLVFHNGTDAAAKQASIIGVFQLTSSADGTAFRFSVARWEHKHFLKQHSAKWFQSDDRKRAAIPS